MILNDVEVTAIEFRRLQGTGKNGKPYDFPVLTIADDKLNRFSVGIRRDASCLNEGKLSDDIQDAFEEHKKIVVDLEIRPDQNDKYGKQCLMDIVDITQVHE